MATWSATAPLAAKSAPFTSACTRPTSTPNPPIRFEVTGQARGGRLFLGGDRGRGGGERARGRLERERSGFGRRSDDGQGLAAERRARAALVRLVADGVSVVYASEHARPLQHEVDFVAGLGHEHALRVDDVDLDEGKITTVGGDGGAIDFEQQGGRRPRGLDGVGGDDAAAFRGFSLQRTGSERNRPRQVAGVRVPSDGVDRLRAERLSL